MKQEKKDLEDRLASVTLRAEQNQETSRREERLLLSAVYDVGLRIMDAKVCPPSHTRSIDLFLTPLHPILSYPYLNRPYPLSSFELRLHLT